MSTTRNIAALEENEFDIVIIGGGIFGAWAACDASQRGLSVALIERDDFCASTSANHLKMIHGGIRYLQHLDFYRIRQSSNERKALLKVAPHLARPLPIAIPTYGMGMKGKPALRTGFGMYDFITFDKNWGMADPRLHIPKGRIISRDETLKMFPGFSEDEELTGTGIFYDGQLLNPPRLVFAIIQSAVANGAVVANYVEATGFNHKGNRIQNVEAKDRISGDTIKIRGKAILNAAGPFAENLLSKSLNARLSPEGIYSRDASFVVHRKYLAADHALAVQCRTKDPDAMLSRGARHLFTAPWRDYTLVGVWHVVWKKSPDEVTVSEEELSGFIDEFNEAYPAMNLTLGDVSLINTGLVPFGENKEGAKNLRYGHRSRFVEHKSTHGIENLYSLIGVRFTTGRIEAVQAIDKIAKILGKALEPTLTLKKPVFGGDITNVSEFIASAIKSAESFIDAETVRSLVHTYGTDYNKVLERAGNNGSLLKRIANSKVIAAQIIYSIEEEMAQNLGDVVFRRTDLCTGDYPGRNVLKQCANLMADKLNWSPERIESELDTVASRFISKRVETVDSYS